MHTINATTKEREASRIARHGKRYYPVDESYDKRVYENSGLNYVKIVTCLIVFWIFQACHWWGVLSLGIVATDALIWYSIACFVFTVLFLIGILFAGARANRFKRETEFYTEKIAEKRSELQEKDTKAKQDAAHQAKLSAQAEKLAKERRAAEAAEMEAPAEQNTGVAGQQYAINADAPTAMAPTTDGRLIQENRM